MKAEEPEAETPRVVCTEPHSAVPSIRLMRPTFTNSAFSCLRPETLRPGSLVSCLRPGCPRSPEQAQPTTRPAPPPHSSGLYSNVTTSQRDLWLPCICVSIHFAFLAFDYCSVSFMLAVSVLCLSAIWPVFFLLAPAPAKRLAHRVYSINAP